MDAIAVGLGMSKRNQASWGTIATDCDIPPNSATRESTIEGREVVRGISSLVQTCEKGIELIGKCKRDP